MEHKGKVGSSGMSHVLVSVLISSAIETKGLKDALVVLHVGCVNDLKP